MTHLRVALLALVLAGLASEAWSQCTELTVGQTGGGRNYNGPTALQSAITAIDTTQGCYWITVDSGQYNQIYVDKFSPLPSDSIVIRCRTGHEPNFADTLSNGCRIKTFSATTMAVDVTAQTKYFKMRNFKVRSTSTTSTYKIFRIGGDHFDIQNVYGRRHADGEAFTFGVSAPLYGKLRNFVFWNSSGTSTSRGIVVSASADSVFIENGAIIGFNGGTSNGKIHNVWSRKLGARQTRTSTLPTPAVQVLHVPTPRAFTTSIRSGA